MTFHDPLKPNNRVHLVCQLMNQIYQEALVSRGPAWAPQMADGILEE